MEKNEEEVLETEEVVETEEVEETETEGETSEEEEVDYKALYEAEKGRRKRAESTVDKLKTTKSEEPKKEVKEDNLSSFLQEALDEITVKGLKKQGFGSEDINDIKEYARLKKISVEDALEAEPVKRMLENATELSTSNKVLNKEPVKVSSGKLSDSQILAKAQTGKQLTDAELERLAYIR